MDLVKEIMPYLVSIFSGLLSYLAANKKFKHELSLVKENNKHDLDKLIKQHEVNIDNLKEEHRLRMEALHQQYEHEKEIIKLNSKNAISEDKEKTMNSVMADVAANVFNDIISGKIDMQKLMQLQKEANDMNKNS